jgi:nitroreductase
LEYLIIHKGSLKDKVFAHLRWAAYISPKRNPPPNKKPTFYIIILINQARAQNPNLRDIGAAAQNILLALEAHNLAGCWLQNIDKEALQTTLRISFPYEIDSIIAAGCPDESPKLETDAYNIKYWLDNRNVLHVPKRPLKDVFHYERI